MKVKANGAERSFISHWDGWDTMDTACFGFYIKPEYVLNPVFAAMKPSFLEMDYENCWFTFWGDEDQGIEGKLVTGSFSLVEGDFEILLKDE
ncbi:hypothetical protein QE320_gp144 [Pseudomonas phage EM]|uniref:Uncharacterized protein n=1 Tax=Pseudomonas phage EM TaxID=2936914 RepID=A0AAE9HGI3_9CAUD|nr:hypothetical protein QE320_gp144 [Pseudomonas phage EM]UPW35910.1 hypothetical protein EM_125 [Pseudomonas phage EM]